MILFLSGLKKNGWLATFICHNRYILNTAAYKNFNEWKQENEKL